jgi:hypothetical protein
VSRPDQYQLKIACFNYYPNKAAITIDPWRRSKSSRSSEKKELLTLDALYEELPTLTLDA